MTVTMTMSALQGKIAIVTGGGSGMGRATALAFAQAGAQVVIANRTRATAEAVAAEIVQAGGQALPLSVDVSRGEDMQRLMQTTLAHFGGLDVLFNNAGISPSGTVTDITEAEWDECLNIDLKSVFLGCKYAIPLLQQRGGGVILNNAGTFGLKPVRGKAAYATAKAGVINLTRAVALDYARDNIRCNVLCPGYVDTPLTEGVPPADRDAFLGQYQPLRGVIQPAEVAALALYLAGEAARMITGQVFVLDGGQQAGIF
ncbi:MAG: SDR family oxidoreductase [Anaerolineae bacterium]|jgi:3-oxoacyl-[acyl-carrier protein] reductase|nr:SDR family oxidoreductase [Anaerolineae bacterium]